MKLIWLHRVFLISLLGFYFTNLLQGQTTPVAGDILFTHADATLNGELFEFITLKRLNLNNLKFTDNGICSNGSFRKNEEDMSLPSSGLSDIESGTLVRVYGDSTNTNEINSLDGIITIYSTSLGGFSQSGDQIISFAGTLQGLAGCGGTGTNNFISGINWGTVGGWITSGTPTSNTSYSPGTATDIEIKNTFDVIWFNDTISGNVASITSATGSGVRNSSNWSGTNTGTGTFLPLKNIQFHSSNYNTGTATASSGGGTTSTLNLSGLSFSNSDSDTRYLVLVNEGASPSTPANRFTCYTPNLNYGSAPNVVTSVTTPPCTGPTTGNGKVVYFNYTLPISLILTGLTNNTCYNVQVYAINGNGYSANYSSTPASFNFFTGNLVSSIHAY